MSSLVPETNWVQGASGTGAVYDNSPSGLGMNPSYLAAGANASSISNTSIGSGSEIGYNEITTTVTVASSTEASGTTVIAGSAYTFDGQPVYALFYSPAVITSATANDFVVISLFLGATQIARLFQITTPAAAQMAVPANVTYRFTPAAGSHTYSITAYRGSANGAVTAGTSGTGNYAQSFLRLVKA